MMKQYFSDCLLHIAILWSLFRIDPNNFSVPNNEILNYPEVQDILQGQTLAYMPTNFHNQYNTLNTIHGYAHPKHADNDIYHSALFRNLQRFRGVPTNIEAFLASSDITVNFDQPLQAGDLPPTGGSSIGNQHEEDGDSVATSTAQANTNVQVDANHNTVCVGETDFSNPFPGLELCKEDLDLIEVLWRQDVDLGVSKDVFDPNLRRELQHERELEVRKEEDEQKVREKDRREQEQQAQQWLTDNFVRDGETGEWMPIDGSGATSVTAGPSPSFLFPEPAAEESLSLEEALNFVGELSNHSYVEPHYLQQHQQKQQQQQQQPEVAAAQLLPDNQSLDSGDLNFLNDFDETGISGYAQQPHNQTETDHLNRTWQEVVNYISDIVSNTPATNISNNNNNNDNTTVAAMAPVDTQVLISPAEVGSAPMVLHNQQQTYHHHHQQQQQQQQQLNNSLSLGMLDQSQSQAVSSLATTMSETRHVLQDEGGSGYAGGLGESGMLLHNVTMPVVPTALDNQHSPLTGAALHPDNGLASQDYNASNPDQDNLNSLDWVAGELFFSNITTDFDNLTSAIANSTMLDPSDLLTSMLPPDGLDMNFNDGLETVAMMEDTGSDSAVSMSSMSPQQEVNEAMESSPFDGLEGATGGSDYESSGYGHRSNHSGSNVEDDGFNYSGSSYGSPASVNTNFSTGSNDTEHSTGHSATRLNHVNHNHTYPTQPGQTPREVKKYAKKDGPRQKGPQSRDMKRAQDLKLPFSFERIVESPVEEFNDMLTKSKLTEAQLSLMRDIRRRGKNKVAAQNCRKRKLDVLFTLEDEMGGMERERERLREERRQMDLQAKQAREKYSTLYDHIFRSLRDEHGQPYDPALFSLQQSSDGNVFLVRLNATSATSVVPTPPSSSASSPPAGGSPSSSSSSSSSGKRKNFTSSSTSSCSAQHKKKSKE